MNRFLPLLALLLVASTANAAGLARSKHFSVITERLSTGEKSDQLAKAVANLAEKYRREVAVEWFGRELPDGAGRSCVSIHFQDFDTGGLTWAIDDPSRSFHNIWVRTSKDEPDHLRKTLKHEVFHAVAATFHPHPNRVPSELEEAIAYTYNRPTTDAKRAELKRRLREWEASQ